MQLLAQEIEPENARLWRDRAQMSAGNELVLSKSQERAAVGSVHLYADPAAAARGSFSVRSQAPPLS